MKKGIMILMIVLALFATSIVAVSSDSGPPGQLVLSSVGMPAIDTNVILGIQKEAPPAAGYVAMTSSEQSNGVNYMPFVATLASRFSILSIRVLSALALAVLMYGVFSLYKKIRASDDYIRFDPRARMSRLPRDQPAFAS